MPGLAAKIVSTRACASQVIVENEILELFAPMHEHRAEHSVSGRSDQTALWRADAIHRAKNLAQLTLSLATLAEHPSRRWLPQRLIAQTRCLARAYAELGLETGDDAVVPCAPPLTEIATRLVAIFGGARHIDVTVDAAPIMLAPDARRALVLMCSEMVINALKYAFPGGGGGSIHVALTFCDGQIELIVEDDGVGHAPDSPGGHGHRLLDELGALCGATVGHGPGRDGAGYRVCSQLPAMVVMARQA